MNSIVIALALMLSSPAMAVETKKVCHEEAGKQVCKNVKIHKKAEKVTEGSPTDPVKKEDKKKK
jgi:hypothetical protein